MSKIKLILTTIINLLPYGIAQVIPKNKKIWVFGAWFGQKYADNPKAFFEYVNQNAKEINPIWISKNKNVVNEVNSLGYQAYYYLSIPAIYFQLRAHLVIICQSLHDDLYAPCIGKRAKVIQLWHGIPLKHIMYDVFGDRLDNKNFKGRLVDALSPYNKHRNDFAIATSELTQKIIAKAFRIPEENTLITGFPRNDVFFKETSKINGQYQCIYMPTFRGGIGTECDLFTKFGFDFDLIEKKLKQHNIVLTLRMHPVNKPPEALVRLMANSAHIIIDSSADIYDTISRYDCLITDYSSIYFDFLLSNKPIIFAPFDLASYKEKERALYFDYEGATLAPYSMSWAEVIDRIIDFKTSAVADNYNTDYQELKARFHGENQLLTSPFSTALYKRLLKL